MLVVKPAPKPLARAVLQFDLVPIRRRSTKEVSEENHRRQMAADLADYLAEHPEMRPAIRSKRKKFSVPRSGREGDRPESLGTGPLTARERSEMLEDLFILEAEGVKVGPPTTLAGCKKTGPCPHVSCRHHNYLEVDGDIVKVNFPHLGPEELKNPCSLRVAGRAGKRKPTGPNGEVMSHAEVSKELNLSCERTRQLETVALRKVRRERPDLR